jgi:hypothetical protein
MGENADRLKQAYEAFADGDLDGATELWSDGLTWDGTNDDKLPLGGRIEGKDSVKQALAGLGEQWESFSAVPDEFHDSDGTVIVLGHGQGKAKKTGTELKWPFVHVWRFSDGEATEVLALADTYEIAKALDVISSDGAS